MALSVPSAYGRNAGPLPIFPDREDSIFVAQREQAIVRLDKGLVDYGSMAHSLKTAGLATCVGVVIYDPVTKTGALAHVDEDSGQTLRMSITGLQTAFSQAAGFSISGLAIPNEIKKRLSTYMISNGEDPATYREILKLLLVDGFTLEQISEIKGQTASLDLATGHVSEFKPNRLFYDLRKEIALQDIGRTKFPPDGHLKTISPCELSLMQKRPAH